MKVIVSKEMKTQQLQDACVALGFFDGLHKGHLALLDKVSQIAAQKHLKKGVMTFDVHPKSYITKQDFKYLTSLEDKKRILEELDFDYLYVISFDADFSKLSPAQFMQSYIIDLHIKHVVCGFDYRFGYRGEGTVQTLRDANICGVSEISKKEHEQHKIASSYIREAIKEGNIELANTLLSRPYAIRGEVIHGFQRGSKELGFATANIEYLEYALPEVGVYCVRVKVADTDYIGMANIGYNPTFGDLKIPSLEVHIFDFDALIYGEMIQVFFFHKERGEKRFASKEELIAQLQTDKQNIQKYFLTNTTRY